MPDTHARHVVLGAGAMGAATAYHLAKRGEPVLLVEQFGIGHDRGSSHGAGRITRHSYADPAYARLMPEAFRAWKTLEADAGEPLYARTGGVSISPRGVDYVGRVAANLADLGVPHRRMTGAELNRVLPVFGLAGDADVVFEPDAGIIAAARAVAAQVRLAREFGQENTVVREHCPVLRIDLDARKPTLVTGEGTITADRLVVTAGAWTRKLLPGFPVALRPTRQQVLYARPPEADAAAYGPGRMPVFIYKGDTDLDDYYGMPAHDGNGVKVARHGGPDVDPDDRNPVISEEYRELIRRFLGGTLPALADAPFDRSEVCLYTVAPGERFHVGAIAGSPDVIAASPCSGHGFKFSCLVGRVLADLATVGETDVPIDAWSLGAVDDPA